jgi:AraC-like DNA-binding protein
MLLQKIARFIGAKRRLESDPSVPLVRVALECGYVDQSHFATTFRKLFDVTPAHFCRQVRQARALLTATKSDVVFLQEQGERSQ